MQVMQKIGVKSGRRVLLHFLHFLHPLLRLAFTASDRPIGRAATKAANAFTLTVQQDPTYEGLV
jgi:hypothetical protein